MHLNADLGESYGDWAMGNDQAIMAFIDQANVACGYHAGDAMSMIRSISLAKTHNVMIGAHVAYPDLQGFGRRSMRIPTADLSAMIQAQIATLEGLAKSNNMALSHVKPHGALYNDMMQNIDIFEAVVKSVDTYHVKYPLVIQALNDNSIHKVMAEQYGVCLILEAFADRAYDDDGFLVSRSKAGAVLAHNDALLQVKRLIENHQIISINGKVLNCQANTICVHSDNHDAVRLAKHIYTLLLGK